MFRYGKMTIATDSVQALDHSFEQYRSAVKLASPAAAGCCPARKLSS